MPGGTVPGNVMWLGETYESDGAARDQVQDPPNVRVGESDFLEYMARLKERPEVFGMTCEGGKNKQTLPSTDTNWRGRNREGRNPRDRELGGGFDSIRATVGMEG